MPRPDDLVSIGRFASAARVTVKALRHYHEQGLVEPRWIDPTTGYRYYSWDQLEVAVRVAALRDLDAPIEAIRAHLRGGLPLRELAAAQRSRRISEIRSATTALAALEDLVDGVEPGPYEVDTIDVETTTTWTLRRTIRADELDRGATELIDELLDAATRAGLDTSPPVWGEYPARLDGVITVAAHLPVPTAPPPSDGPGEAGTIPAGAYARVVHHGSVATLPFAYRSLLADLDRRSVDPRGPVFERYLTDDPELGPGSSIEVFHPFS